MLLQERIQKDTIVAMKARDTNTLSTLRNLSSEIKNAIIDHKGEFTDADTESIVIRQVKQLKDAIKYFEAGGRMDLVEQNIREIATLERYLPEQTQDEELHSIVAESISIIGAKSTADIGKVMAMVMGRVRGRADGNRVREVVVSLLA